jgi:RimJ/RimL family protein N-acetyltransferase
VLDRRLTAIRLTPWATADLALLRLTNAPEMTEHLGGPETEEQLIHRHRRYLARTDPGAGLMYVIRLGDDAVGSVGFWERVWHDQDVYEIGWGVLPAYQGRGIAVAAARATADIARAEGRHRFLHAFPSVDNPPSNAVCRNAGFTLLGEYDFEYPPGHPMRCHDWQLDLGERTSR